jgi:hypothetical protein
MTRTSLNAAATELAPVEISAVGRSVAPVWFASLLAPEVAEELERVGLEGFDRYFAARSAPLGAASLPLVLATFFNFSPAAVGRAIPAAWDKATPEDVLDAQRTGVDRALRRAFADVEPGIVSEAASLLRRAAEAASRRPEGRPLFAAYAALPWPDDDHLVLWHAQYLLREFRGDGHIAVLVAEGLTGIESLVLHIAMLPMVGPMFRQTRAWTDQEWDAAVEHLRSDGWIDTGEELGLTAEGIDRRKAIESRTDELDLPGFGAIGAAGCQRVIELAEPITAALSAAGLAMSFPPPQQSSGRPATS